MGSGGLGLPDRDNYLETDAKSVELRSTYVAYAASLLHLAGESEAQAEAEATAVLKMETDLAKASLTRVERRDPHNTSHKMTIAELSALTPAIDWPRYFATQDAAGVSSLNVSQPAFLRAMQTVLTSASMDDLKAYTCFHLLTTAAPEVSEPFRQASFDFYSKTLRGVPALPPRWKTCVRMTDRMLGKALGQEFVRRTFTSEMKNTTRVMTEQVEAATKVEIGGLDWMSAATKQEALRKLAAIRNKIGYPDKWRDCSALTEPPDDFFSNVTRASQVEGCTRVAQAGQAD